MPTQSIDEKIAQLTKFELYNNLSKEQLALIADAHYPKHFSSGESLVIEDQVGGDVFFILKGKAIITLFNEVTKKNVEIGIASDGCCTGHYILAKEIPRTANVTAVTDMDVLVTDVNDLYDFFETNVDIGMTCYRNLSRIMLGDIIGNNLFIKKLHQSFTRDISKSI